MTKPPVPKPDDAFPYLIHNGAMQMIDQALDALPPAILGRSGSVFYTGREAFAGPAPIYVLGLNPGGDPTAQAEETIARDIADFRSRTDPWSAYADARWQGAQPGTWSIQPRMLHLFGRLGLDSRRIPASNIVFVRSRSEAALAAEKDLLMRACWPVHQAVIDSVNPAAILCLGATAGAWVRERLDASEQIDLFREANDRGWTSRTHRTRSGAKVVTVTHPGRVDWRNPAADPAPLIARAMG